MALSDRRRALLDSARWRALEVFAARWYARPLSDEDGHTPLEIEEAERRLGTRLPAALAEWFELVGRRLRLVQDHPVPLGALEVENDAVRIWSENQGVWSVHVPLDGDDPITFATDDANSSPDAPLNETLFGLLVSDTLVGSWSGRGEGSLGRLGASVVGGYCDTFDDETVAKLHAAFPPLAKDGLRTRKRGRHPPHSGRRDRMDDVD